MEVGIILMAGSGLRFGGETPKQFREIGGTAIYLHTLQKFIESGLFHQIILVCHPDWVEKVQSEIPQGAAIVVVPGGATRQESSWKGLQACPPETKLVVIHDAVRPFVSEQILRKNIEMARLHGAVDTCIPSADTIVRSEDGKTISEIPLRSQYFRGQTPQSFVFGLIYEAHQKTLKTNASDDCLLVLEMNRPVEIVIGDEANIKITTEVDLATAELLAGVDV